MTFLDRDGWPVVRFENPKRSWWLAFVNFTRILIHTRSIEFEESEIRREP